MLGLVLGLLWAIVALHNVVYAFSLKKKYGKSMWVPITLLIEFWWLRRFCEGEDLKKLKVCFWIELLVYVGFMAALVAPMDGGS